MAIVSCIVQGRPADLVALGAQELQWDLDKRERIVIVMGKMANSG